MMFAWLADELRESTQLLTASRRLARTLREAHGLLKLREGRKAWRTPPVYYWKDWVRRCLDAASVPDDARQRISASQSRVLLERCIRRESVDPLVNVGMLARQIEDCRSRLEEWAVSLEECRATARSRDQHLFVRVNEQYLSILEQRGWLDVAGTTTEFLRLIEQGTVAVPGKICLAGFDRLTPQLEQLRQALETAGCEVRSRDALRRDEPGSICVYETGDGELRAAGAWARAAVRAHPGARVGIVVSDLERSSRRAMRMVREGLEPGWQGGVDCPSGINVSYGVRLADYPVIGAALRLLEWVHSDLPTPKLSILLRSEFLAFGSLDGRSRIELGLRRRPVQSWSPESLLQVTGNGANDSDAGAWLALLNDVAAVRESNPGRQSPSAWAAAYAGILDRCGWPTAGSLDSEQFQLINRWRELLNEFARLELVLPEMGGAEAFGRLQTLASETLFQPESQGAVIQLLGPLEAAGLEFDKLWVTGCTAASWPRPGRPLHFVSRDLQREKGMPDASPEDTLRHASRVLCRLFGSAGETVASYSRLDGDTEQTASGLLPIDGQVGEDCPADPGWHAAGLVSRGTLRTEAVEVPPVALPGETIGGGVATIQRQREEPFAAFARGRLGVESLQPFGPGLGPLVRGNLVHEALRLLYAERPAREVIAGWSAAERTRRCATAASKAVGRLRRTADTLLKRLLELEEQRLNCLLAQLLAVDLERPAFRVEAVERKFRATIGGAEFAFRIDRIDRIGDSVALLDYKTGTPGRLLARDGSPRDVQLVAYSSVVEWPVGGLALVAVDSRAVAYDACGPAFRASDDWQESLSAWQSEVETLAREIAAGDLRVDASKSATAARPLALLSRFPELRRDGA